MEMKNKEIMIAAIFQRTKIQIVFEKWRLRSSLKIRLRLLRKDIKKTSLLQSRRHWHRRTMYRQKCRNIRDALATSRECKMKSKCLREWVIWAKYRQLKTAYYQKASLYSKHRIEKQIWRCWRTRVDARRMKRANLFKCIMFRENKVLQKSFSFWRRHVAFTKRIHCTTDDLIISLKTDSVSYLLGRWRQIKCEREQNAAAIRRANHTSQTKSFQIWRTQTRNRRMIQIKYHRLKYKLEIQSIAHFLEQIRTRTKLRSKATKARDLSLNSRVLRTKKENCDIALSTFLAWRGVSLTLASRRIQAEIMVMKTTRERLLAALNKWSERVLLQRIENPPSNSKALSDLNIRAENIYPTMIDFSDEAQDSVSDTESVLELEPSAFKLVISTGVQTKPKTRLLQNANLRVDNLPEENRRKKSRQTLDELRSLTGSSTARLLSTSQSACFANRNLVKRVFSEWRSKSKSLVAASPGSWTVRPCLSNPSRPSRRLYRRFSDSDDLDRDCETPKSKPTRRQSVSSINRVGRLQKLSLYFHNYFANRRDSPTSSYPAKKGDDKPFISFFRRRSSKSSVGSSEDKELKRTLF